jgi:hypothetical protein
MGIAPMPWPWEYRQAPTFTAGATMPVIRPLTDNDFPIIAQGHNVYRRTESSPICTCADQGMAAEIAKRLNRDNQVYPDAQR